MAASALCRSQHANHRLHSFLSGTRSLGSQFASPPTPVALLTSAGWPHDRHPGSTNSHARQRRLFVLQERCRFELRTHASSVRELRDHWAVVEAYDPEEMEEPLVRRQDEMYAHSQEVLERSPGAELVYVEPPTMTRLMPAG